MAKHTGKPSPTRLWPVALLGKERKSRGGEEKKSMWKGKEEDSEGTQADVQAAIPADSILLSLSLSFFLLPLSSACLSSAPQTPLVRLIFNPSLSLSALILVPQRRRKKSRERQ